LDYVDDTDWLISQDFFEKFDTIYGERGETYDVNACLIAFNKNGCSDTTCQIITIYEPPALSTVNVFSPNGDGRNDLFTLDNFAKGINTFECIIINRWGVKVGEITEIDAGWNGKDLNGDLCSDGVYFFKYVAVADNGTPFSGQGTVSLVSGGE
jgi:gliding motility-associated-like protein